MLHMFVSRKGLVQLQGTALLQTELLLARTEILAPNKYLFPSMFHFPAWLPLQSSHLLSLHRFSGDNYFASFTLFSNTAFLTSPLLTTIFHTSALLIPFNYFSILCITPYILQGTIPLWASQKLPPPLEWKLPEGRHDVGLI